MMGGKERKEKEGAKNKERNSGGWKGKIGRMKRRQHLKT